MTVSILWLESILISFLNIFFLLILDIKLSSDLTEFVYIGNYSYGVAYRHWKT
jgi:hypothetical protein